MIFVFGIISIIYIALISVFIIGFDKIEAFTLESYVDKITFSIIIPFRNEAENLPDLLQSLSKLDYTKDLFEIIFVDDASEDNSVELLTNFKIKSSLFNIEIVTNQRMSNSPKKDAITTAIHIAKHKWIVTTDADCIVPIKWLKTLNSFIQKHNPKMVVAPVTYHIKNTFFEYFQLLDFLSLQSVTIAGFGIKRPFLCNAANLAYKKDLFISLNGFNGNIKIASGDDIFLMEKAVKKYPKKVKYLKSKNALVTTSPQVSIKDLIHQRLRWAAKTSSLDNTFGKGVGIIVLLMNILIIIVTLLTIIGTLRFELMILIFSLKFFLDFALIHKSAHYLSKN